jgi:diguanylate cyclase (GGDEF)-like protein/PAS domain S-box-containing protein
MNQSRFFKKTSIIVVLTSVYFVAGKLGLMLAFVTSSTTAVWPCTGIALAAFLMLGYRAWPGILLGAFLVNVTTSGSVTTSIGISLGNTAEGLLGAYLVGRFAHGRNAFDRAQDIFKFTVLAGMVSTATSATMGVTSLSLGGFSEWTNFAPIWLTWWVGDAVGSLIVTPFLILWSTRPRSSWKRHQIIEVTALFLIQFLVAQIVFGGLLPIQAKNYPLGFLSIPILIWAAFRFGQREASTALIILSGTGVWGTLRGYGPFVMKTPNESLLLLQTYIGVLNITILSLSAVVSEHRRALKDLQKSREELEQRVASRTEDLLNANRVMEAEIAERKRVEENLAESKNHLRMIIDSEPDCLKLITADGTILDMNPAGLAMIEADSKEQVIGKCIYQLVSPENQSAFMSLNERVFSGESETLEFEIVGLKGTHRWLETHAVPFRNTKGEIIAHMSNTRDITERKQTEERLSYLANYDLLTGLPNRILLFDRLEQAIPRVRWQKRLVAVLFLDLDNFKQINDTLGHNTGDLLLKAVGERLTRFVRQGDTVARLGGDEFVLVLADLAKAEDVPQIAQKILDGLSKPFDLEGVEIFTGASIGITLDPTDGEDPETLLKNADAAMYKAKEQGRNHYQFYSSSMNIKILERLSIETDLHHALEREEFLLHYQPQVDLHSGQIIGMEALIRWNKSGSEMISPAKFIPVAEETGLILPIGEWVLRVACAQCNAWTEEGLSPVFMAVNLSARQFQQQNVVEMVNRILNETGLKPNYLELELTESILMKREDVTNKTLHKLNAMGVRLSIDDFGTGYSSLSYLKRFPIDKLKIDQSFIQDVVSDPDNAAIVAAIITLGHSLGLKVIAEAVETREQLEFLRSIECDEMQGYLFSRPLTSDQATKVLLERKSL